MYWTDKLLGANVTWFCRTCKDKIFPFNSIDNTKLLNCMEIPKTCPPISHSPTAHTNCSHCSKTVIINHRKIICSNCNHYVHKKCSLLKPKDYVNMNWDTWECLTCYKDKFPLTDIAYDELLMSNFNSNLTCSCTTKNKNLSTNNLNTILTSHTDNDFHNTDDIYDNCLDFHPNFKYYEVHDFHKMTDINKNKHTSILHTNICSLRANFESLEILLNDLEHRFDIIALSETWNPDNKQHPDNTL